MKKRKNLNIWLPMLMFLLLMLSTATAEIIFVDTDANGVNDGSSWTDAYNYLQDALANANSGDEIWVAQGTYKPDEDSAHPNGTGSRTATFRLINGVAIKGGYAGFGEPDPNARDIHAYETILSGDLSSDDAVSVDIYEPTRAENSYHVVMGSGTDRNAVLDGFTIAAGNANGSSWPNCIGGGMRNSFGSPTVLNCTFSENSAKRGGGMDADGATVLNCTFSRNSVSFLGGGVDVGGVESRLVNCTITGNSADWGGGIGCSSSERTTVVNCSIVGNSAGRGGGIFSLLSNPTLTNCIFSGNSARGNGGGMYSESGIPPSGPPNPTFSSKATSNNGGGTNTNWYSPTLTNCTFSGNSAEHGGGGMYNNDCDPTLANCTFAGNLAPYGNALACESYVPLYPSNVQITNCILWDGGGEIWNNDNSTITIAYSNVQGGWPGEGNIDADPCFADPANGDYHLKSQAGRWDPNSQSWVQDANTSPCIDAGNPSGPIGYEPFPNGGRINMGVYGGTAEASKSYFGEPICETIVAGDINGDCKVDFVDFGIMALHWLEDNSLYREVPEFYYYYDNQKMYLELYTAMIAVYFQETLSQDEREALIRQDPILEAIVAEMGRYGVVLVGTKAGSSDIDIIQTIERLEKLPEVRYSTPVFGDSTTQLILTDEFIAKFKPDVTEAEIDAFNTLNGVEIEDKIEGIEHYILRVKDPKNMNMLKMANLYSENPITIFSVPNFIAIGELP